MDLRGSLQRISEEARAVSGEGEVRAVQLLIAGLLAGLRAGAAATVRLLDRDSQSYRLAEPPTANASRTPPLAAIGEGLARAVAQTRRPLRVVDTAVDPATASEPWADTGFRSALGAPVEVAGEVVGVLSLLIPDAGPPTADEQELVGMLAGQLSVAIRNAKLCAENDARRRVAEALGEVGRLLTETVDPEAVARRIAERLGSLLEVRCAVVHRLTCESGDLEVLAMAGDAEPGVGPGSVIPAGTGAAGLAAARRSAVVTPDVFEDSRVSLDAGSRARIGESGLRAALAIPLIVKDAVIGVLSVEAEAGRQFTSQDILLAQGFAHHAALTLQRARLFAEAMDRLSEREMLLAIAQEFSSGVPRAEALRRAVRLLARTFKADMAGAYFLDRGRAALVPVAGYRVPPDLLSTFLGTPFPMSRFAFLREAWGTGKPVWTADYLGDRRFDQDFLSAHRPTSLLFAPTRVNGEVVGGLFLVWWATRRHFGAADLRLVEAVATQIGLALENADLSRQRQAENAAPGDPGRFQALVEQSADAVALFSPAGIIEYANPMITRVLGYAVDECIGRNACELAHPDDVTAIAELFKTLVNSPGERVAGQYRLRHKDGSWRWVEGVGTNLLGEPSVRAIVGSYRDITARKDAEAAQRMTVAGQLAGGVAHDFNNLLTVILGRSQLLRKRLSPTDPLRREVDLIERTAARAAGLTEQLLAFGRRQMLRPEVLDVNGVIDGLVPKLRRFAGDGIVVVSLPASRPAYIKADPGHFERMLMHLALNARDAMAEGGTFALAVSTATLAPEFVREHPGARPGPHVVVTARDTGHGMTGEIQQRIFEPFFTTRGAHGRVGLGLSTVLGIVSQHGGIVTVRSGVGQGTTFALYFPEVEAGGDRGDLDLPRDLDGPAVILLVDDDDHVRELARDMLLLGGYTVLEARSGAEAIGLSERHPGRISLLLTDVVMPGLSGPALGERLSRLRPGLRVLYMSGYPSDVLTGGDRTPDRAILAKPFSEESLSRAVRAALGGSLEAANRPPADTAADAPRARPNPSPQ
jgi:PAS domain S-box-containing protein